MISYDVEWYHHLPTHVKEILERLQHGGHIAYVVGGAVRDMWLGIKPKDFDIVSDASPEQIEALFPKTLGIGRAFGIMIVVTPEGPVEIARFRTDGAYTDGRHPKEVTFSNPEEDARRRDFRINALFYDKGEEKVLDYVGGVSDLKEKIIQTVGKAADRFQEDSLRMLRAVRFHAQLGHLGFELESSLLRAIHLQADRLQLVSHERITQELLKIFDAVKPSIGLLDLREAGLWQPVFGAELAKGCPLSRFDDLSARLESAFGLEARPELFLAAAERWIPGLELQRQLVLSKDVKLLLPQIASHSLTLAKFNELDLAGRKRLLASPGLEEAWVILAVEGQLTEAFDEIPKIKKLWSQEGTLDPPAYLKGSDFVSLGLPPGPAIKAALEKIRTKQLNEEILSREEALALARTMIDGQGNP